MGDSGDDGGPPLSPSLSCPTVVIGHPESFLFPGIRDALSCHSPWILPEDGFPLKTGGNDRGEIVEMT